MNARVEVLLLNAAPLLILAALYGGVAVGLGSALWRERLRVSRLGLAVWLLFVFAAALSGAIGGLKIGDGRMLVSGASWLVPAAAAVAAVPALIVLVRWSDRALLTLADRHLLRAQERVRGADAITRLSALFTRAAGSEEAVGYLFDELERLLGVELAVLTSLTEDGKLAVGFAARGAQGEWWRSICIDLATDPGGVATAVREQTAFAIDDVTVASNVNRHLASLSGALSAAFIPLISDGDVTGVLVAATVTAHRRFSGAELDLIQGLVNETALALGKARSGEELQLALERQKALLGAATALTSVLRVEPLLGQLAEQAEQLLGADAVDCWLLDEERQTLRCRAAKGFPEEIVGLELAALFPLDEGASIGRPLVARPLDRSWGEFRDVLDVPVVWGGKSRGLLGFWAREESRFRDADVELLDVFARLASLALANADNFEERERQAQIQRGFYRIAHLLSQPLSRAEMLDALAQAAAEAFGGAGAVVLAPHGERMVPVASYQLPAEVRTALERTDGEVGAFGRVAREGRPIVSHELSLDERLPGLVREQLARSGFGSFLAAAVGGNGVTHTAVVLFAGERSFTVEDIALAEHLAEAARGALERSVLFETEYRARSLAQRLAEVVAQLAGPLAPESILEAIAQEAVVLLEGEAALLWLPEGEDLVVRAASSASSSLPGQVGTRVGAGDGLAGEVAQTRSPVGAETGSGTRLQRGDPLLGKTMAAALGAPLLGQEGLIGVLTVYTAQPRSFAAHEVEALFALATAGAAAYANALLYAQMAEARARDDAVFANIADGIVAVDREGRVVLWNAAAGRITGVPASEASGRTVPEVLQRELAASGSQPERERQIPILRAGKEVWLSLTEAVMRNQAGGVAGRVFAFRDVSSERTLEQLKSDFIATVSHRLRTPLASIYGFSQTLLRRDVSFSEEERSTFLTTISSESERLIRIVDDLLNVALIESGSIALALEESDVGQAIREVVATAQEHTHGDHRFVLDLGPAPLVALADPERLRQVLRNLVDNAVKFSPRASAITVSGRRRADAVEVKVTDQGVGIAGAHQQRIFSKFYRADSGPRRATPGTGLGLFLARGLVTAMGGRIWVDSKEGEGSSFSFELPAPNTEVDGVPEEAVAAR